MQLVSATNQINYGSYSEGIDWNIQNYELLWGGKVFRGKKALALFSFCVRIHIFTKEFHTELEFLKNDQTLRVRLSGYDRIHDLYIQKIWILGRKQFLWKGDPQTYQILARNLFSGNKQNFGLNFDIRCENALHIHFSYFDQYQIHCIAQCSKSIRSVNPFNLRNWCYTDKHATLECESIQLIVDGNDYSNKSGDALDFQLGYDWSGGYFPPQTETLCGYFWQSLPNRLGATLLLIGHDNCSGESAVWTEREIFRLPRLVPRFTHSENLPADPPKNANAQKNLLLPDLDWEISAGEQLLLRFHPSSISEVSSLVFPITATQRIYGVFSGELKDRFGAAVSIQNAQGFIDYRQIKWHRG